MVSVVLSWYGGEYCGCDQYHLCRKGDVGEEGTNCVCNLGCGLR